MTTSYETFFNFTVGLSKPVEVAKGCYNACMNRVQRTIEQLELEVEIYQGEKRLRKRQPGPNVSDETYCRVVEEHNWFVMKFYADMHNWSTTPAVNGETLTPEQANEFWYGLETLSVPIERWTKEYYKDRMQHLYRVMRGNYSEGVSMGCKKLTTKQAAAVIILFSQYIDKEDIRLDVPQGGDYLLDTNEYVWCPRCGAIDNDDIASKRHCVKGGKCALRKENPDLFDEES